MARKATKTTNEVTLQEALETIVTKLEPEYEASQAEKKAGDPGTIWLDPNKVILDPAHQVRNTNHIDKLTFAEQIGNWAAAMAEGDWDWERSPMPVCYKKGYNYMVLDGFHRTTAAIEAKIPLILYELKEFTDEEANLYSLLAQNNRTNGVPLSASDRRKQVTNFLEIIDNPENIEKTLEMIEKLGINLDRSGQGKSGIFQLNDEGLLSRRAVAKILGLTENQAKTVDSVRSSNRELRETKEAIKEMAGKTYINNRYLLFFGENTTVTKPYFATEVKADLTLRLRDAVAYGSSVSNVIDWMRNKELTVSLITSNFTVPGNYVLKGEELANLELLENYGELVEYAKVLSQEDWKTQNPELTYKPEIEDDPDEEFFAEDDEDDEDLEDDRAMVHLPEVTKILKDANVPLLEKPTPLKGEQLNLMDTLQAITPDPVITPRSPDKTQEEIDQFEKTWDKSKAALDSILSQLESLEEIHLVELSNKLHKYIKDRKITIGF